MFEALESRQMFSGDFAIVSQPPSASVGGNSSIQVQATNAGHAMLSIAASTLTTTHQPVADAQQ